MTRARMPRPHEVAAAQRDPRLLRAIGERDADPGWRTRGVCRTVDPETFFPAPSEPADAAVALCRTCAVQGPCLAWALEVGDCHGVWGATTPRERRAMLVAWRAGQTGPQPVQPVQPVPLAVGLPVHGLLDVRRADMPVGAPMSRTPEVPAVRGAVADPVVEFEVELAERLADQLADLDGLVEQVPV